MQRAWYKNSAQQTSGESLMDANMFSALGGPRHGPHPDHLQQTAPAVDSMTAANEAAHEIILAVRTVRSFNAEKHEARHDDDRLMDTHRVKTRRDTVRIMSLLEGTRTDNFPSLTDLTELPEKFKAVRHFDWLKIRVWKIIDINRYIDAHVRDASASAHSLGTTPLTGEIEIHHDALVGIGKIRIKHRFIHVKRHLCALSYAR
ncbi:uncharacterized protein LOC127604264 [Hippocampus zosterae]|uniref:uncharacterized protein LOC127604264 n=1 Tax=Hippocampus zosterae TaxID=109293 RepID=UPI00223D58FD|nr:uncharacterized protein LOC127604264 [Hippocampus zosterae]